VFYPPPNTSCTYLYFTVGTHYYSQSDGQAEFTWMAIGTVTHPSTNRAHRKATSVCYQPMTPSYLADDLHWTDEAESRHRLRSGSCPRLIVPQTRLSTIGGQSFRVTVARAWNSLPTNVTASTSLLSFKRQLKRFLFTKSFPYTGGTLNCSL